MLKSRNQPDGAASVTIEIDGKAVTVPAGITAAAAVMSEKSGYTRTTPVNEKPRAPYCLMGVCFDCLTEINGKANRRACQTVVEDGMRIHRQLGKRMVQDA